jgi:uncharacterized membrane protein
MTTATTSQQRIISVDILRGIVMIIMALDHTRDYFSDYHFNPTDIHQASSAMFLTRWITHFCAPVFIFLSGTSVMLASRKGKSKKDTSLFLLSRGIWLIILELTIVRFGWQFNVDYSLVFVQVIWAIGWSMICLAALVYLPLPAIATIGLVIIFGHNMLDDVSAQSFGSNAILWNIVHEQGFIEYGNKASIGILYPLVPWVAVMALGYCFGKVLMLPIQQQYRAIRMIGAGCIILFIALRYTNVYGDPVPWERQHQWWRTILSFVNCHKYPPSLLYLLMTLGPAIFVMPWLENVYTRTSIAFSVFGRVPMFYYILHIYLIHAMALVTGLIFGYPAILFTSNNTLFGGANGWGFSLDVVYGFWVLAIMLLYYPCKWYMRVKMRYSNWWLSYI